MEFRHLRGMTGVRVTPYEITGAAPGVHAGVPSPAVTLVVDLGEGLVVSTASSPRTTFRCCLGGMHPAPVTIHHEGSQVGVHIDLSPGAVRVLTGMPAGELWNRNVDLGEVVPALSRRLADELGDTCPGDRRRIATEILDDAARRRDHAVPNADAARAWAAIIVSGGRITVGELVERSGWSARHLTALFTAEYGVGPKQAARLVRFDRARRALEAGHPISDVAAQVGYSDQAHLTRDFADFTGRPPRQFLTARTAEFVPL